LIGQQKNQLSGLSKQVMLGRKFWEYENRSNPNSSNPTRQMNELVESELVEWTNKKNGAPGPGFAKARLGWVGLG